MRKVFRDLISQNMAKKVFAEHLPLYNKKVQVPLLEALNKVLAEDVFAPMDIPPFDRASMDGFAVLASDTLGAEEDNPRQLKVIGELHAGEVFEQVVNMGECVEISTGAPMPTGTDAVVMIEYCQRSGEKVHVYRSVTPGENTMAAGADIQMGERVIPQGTVITSREIAILAALGKDVVTIYKPPDIAIFSSGNEIVAQGKPLMPGKLYDINSHAIASNILENGGIPHQLGILPDDSTIIEQELAKALHQYDMLIISGGTSAGMGDLFYQVIDKLGKPGMLVHGVKVKPGKPTILAVCDGTPLIGLPGYPASALSIFQLFVQPIIRSWAGLPPASSGGILKARVMQRIRSVEGRYEFKPMYLIKGVHEWIAYPVPGGSGAITSVALADGFVHIPENTSFIEQDSLVDIHLISKDIRPPHLQIIGSHDLALAKLQQLLQEKKGIYSRSVAVGSNGGVSAIRRGEAHIAGIHLLDPDRGYNKWVADSLEATLVEGYYRNQGFVVKKGNPKSIRTLRDLTRDDVIFINRNPGSGTRVLLDILLEKEGIEPSRIHGYQKSARSHSSSVQAVKMGIVDVCIAIEAAAQDDELDFIPLVKEEYDFLIRNEYVDFPAVSDFIEMLRSPYFRECLNSLSGYELKA